MKFEKHIIPALARLFTAFFFCSILLNFNYPADRYFSWQLLQPSADVWLLFTALALAACFGKRLLFLTTLPVWLFFLFLRLFRLGDTAVPMYLNRPFNLYIDSHYLFDLYDLLKTTARQGEFLLISISVAALTATVMVSSWYALREGAKGLLHKQLRLAFLLASGLLLGSTLIRPAMVVKAPVITSLGRQLHSFFRQQQQIKDITARIEKTVRQRKAGPSTLGSLKGADVLLFVVESYGRTVFVRPAYRQAMEATMRKFSQTLDEHGFMAVSSYLDSPTYGGASWLAHSTLEFGVRVENDIEDKILLQSSLPPLATFFSNSGYRTVSVMPGTRFAYPDGQRFNYEQYYYAWDFDYKGRTFGWAPMADQFVLDWVRRREFLKRGRPLFIRYVLVSSHAAFSIQPPFIPDWESIGDGSIYNKLQPVFYPIYWPNLKNAGDAYLRSLNYDFTTLGDYLAKFVTTDALIIIMGDHQPNLQLTDADEPWSVPVHIISRNSTLLAPFRKRGYTPGLIPDQPLPHAGMETFLGNFLQDFR